MEQLSFDLFISDERKAFDLVYPELCDIIDNAPMDAKILLFKELGDMSSVYFISDSTLVFSIRIRKRSRYLLIHQDYIDKLPPAAEVERKKSDPPEMVRVTVEKPEDILPLVPALRAILYDTSRRYTVFGCCSLYEQCSDEKKCIHKDLKFSYGCYYRKNLADGKIFYGKNRNIG